MEQPRRFETRAVHSGERRGGRDENGSFFPISTPIYASTTFSHADIETTDRILGGEQQGYSYARYDNPTVVAFEEALASLEAPYLNARAFAFASGMSAMHAALTAAELGPGATVLAAERLDGDPSRADIRLPWCRGPLCGRLRPRGSGEEGRGAQAPGRRGRDHLQPTPPGCRHRRRSRDYSRGRHGASGGQHLRHPLPAAPARNGRGPGRPQRDQVPLGPRRPDGRGRRGGAPVRRGTGGDKETRRRDPGHLRGLARSSGPQDTGAQDGAPVRERTPDLLPPRLPQKGREGPPPRPRRPP